MPLVYPATTCLKDEGQEEEGEEGEEERKVEEGEDRERSAFKCFHSSLGRQRLNE